MRRVNIVMSCFVRAAAVVDGHNRSVARSCARSIAKLAAAALKVETGGLMATAMVMVMVGGNAERDWKERKRGVAAATLAAAVRARARKRDQYCER